MADSVFPPPDAPLAVDVVRLRAVVFGSGAAGLRCAERLAALGVDGVAVVTDALGGGTSNLSGSDKQTYYKMGVAGDAPDSPLAFARTLVAGGLCHGDHAYIEGALSTAAFFHLCEIGVPFPHDAFGAHVGYRTDHDPAQRGTSAGPRTSHFMVQRLLERVRAAGVPIHDRQRLVGLWTDDAGRVRGALALHIDASDGAPPRLTLYRADAVVLATGGPGALFAPSVYPAAQTGAHGVALAAGALANNLAECQFGLASTRLRWNLSGTYQQVVPRYFSRGPDGAERDFLPPWFSSPAAMASAIFRKGYQWPFHVGHLGPDGSSRVDLAVAAETRAGRTVYLDFTRDPLDADGHPVPLAALDAEARDYLSKSGADQPTPLERLRHMNPDAIALYAGQGIPLDEPLACAVCFQHQNGGLAVDAWWRATVPGLYAIGETAGTHGVRPGGSALNAGQVGAMRAAEHIARGPRAPDAAEADLAARADALLAGMNAHWRRCLAASSGAAPRAGGALDLDATRADVQARLMDAAGFLRGADGPAVAIAAVRDAWTRARGAGHRLARPADWARALTNEHLLLTGWATLATVAALAARGAGSRGGALALADGGDASASMIDTPGGAWRYHPEHPAARGEVVTVRYDAAADAMAVDAIAPRPLPDGAAWYETVWAAYREGRIYG